MKRWSACLAVLVLAAGAPAQEARENPQTPREFSRATAKLLRRYEGLCTGPVVWVLAFDMSRSGMGKWSDWARQVVSDLITYCMVDGDKLVLIPFDVVVNPPRGGRPGGAAYPTWEVTEADKGRIRAESAELLLWRQDSPDGTAWVSAVEAALKATAAVPRTDQGKLGLCLVISDRDSADLIPQERSAVQAVQGVRPAGQSLWPLPRDVKPIVVYHTCSTAAPAPGTIPTRYMPPWEPPAGATNRLTPVPTPPPPPPAPATPAAARRGTRAGRGWGGSSSRRPGEAASLPAPARDRPGKEVPPDRPLFGALMLWCVRATLRPWRASRSLSPTISTWPSRRRPPGAAWGSATSWPRAWSPTA